MTDDDANTAAERIEQLSRQAAGPLTEIADPDAHPLLLVREQTTHPDRTVTDKVRLIDLSAYSLRPARRSGGVVFDEPGSFEAYVNEFKGSGSTRLYAKLDANEVIAVFNDDDAKTDGAGAWRDHRASLRVQATEEWQAWRRADRKWFDQTTFAEFLEERLADIAAPPAADLIEIARTFTASNNIAFRSAINLTSGETQFRYEEELEGKAGAKGQIAVPSEFALFLSVYEGTDPEEVTARLRWRLKDGNLSIGYLLIDASKIEREAFRDEVTNMAAATGIEPLYGRPAMPPSAEVPF